MNKLMGFFELKDMDLPSIPWKEYNTTVKLDPSVLWTIRSAVYQGDDLNLPRLVGKDSVDSKLFADNLIDKIQGTGMVIYYPYFIAEKSGTLCVDTEKEIIEAVSGDLWNFVSDGDREVSIIHNDNETTYIGNELFFSESELNEILSHVNTIRKLFRNSLLEGKSVLLEWSYAYKSDKQKNKIGDKYLVFYEVRTIN